MSFVNCCSVDCIIKRAIAKTRTLIVMMIHVIVILACSLTCWGALHDLEAELASVMKGKTMYRSNASGGITVNIVKNGYLIWNLNVTGSCDMQVMSVRYSNDGMSDTVEMFLNERKLGSFRTVAQSKEGELWNVFRSSGVLGKAVPLLTGQNALKLLVTEADKPGVEIDKVTLKSSCFGDPPGSGLMPVRDSGSIVIGVVPTTAAKTSSYSSAELAKIICPTLIGVAGIVSTVMIGTAGIYCKYKKSKRETLISGGNVSPDEEEEDEPCLSGEFTALA